MRENLRHSVIREHGQVPDILKRVNAPRPRGRPPVRRPEIRREDLRALIEEALPSLVHRFVAEAGEETGQ